MCSTMASFESPKYWKNFLLLKIIIKCCLNHLKISIDNTFTIQYVFFFRNICLTKLTNENETTKNILKRFTPNCQQDSWTKAKPDAMQYARKPNQPQPCCHPLICDNQ
jgi:hypothetical protein